MDEVFVGGATPASLTVLHCPRPLAFTSANDLLLSTFGRLATESRHFAARPISLTAGNARHCPRKRLETNLLPTSSELGRCPCCLPFCRTAVSRCDNCARPRASRQRPCLPWPWASGRMLLSSL